MEYGKCFETDNFDAPQQHVLALKPEIGMPKRFGEYNRCTRSIVLAEMRRGSFPDWPVFACTCV